MFRKREKTKLIKGKVTILATTYLSVLLFFSLSTFPQNEQSHQEQIGKYLTITVTNDDIQWQVESSPYGWFLVNGQGAGSLYFFSNLLQWFLPQWFELETSMEVLFRFQVEPLLEGMPENFGFVTFGDVWVGVSMVSQQGLTYAKGSIQEVPFLEVEVLPTESVLVGEGLEGEIWAHWGEARSREGEIVVKGLSSSFDHKVELSGRVNLTLGAGANEIDSAGGGVLRTGIVALSGVDPLGIPKVGDNEFLYQETAWGDPFPTEHWHYYVRLFIPVKAKVVCGFTPSGDLLDWLKGRLDWYIQPQVATNHLLSKRFENEHDGESEIFPVFGEYPWTFFPLRSIGLLFTDEYLPENISDFGKKRVILTFNGQDVHAANIEIFFPARGNMHPPGGPEGCLLIGSIHIGSTTVPNWMYYYYYQVHPQVRYANRGYSFYYEGQDHVHIGNDVINRHAEDVDGLGYLWETYIPILPYSEDCPILVYQVYGIDAYVRAVAHGLEHKRIYDEYHELVEQASQDGVTLDDPFDDFDGDGLPNFVEEQVGTNPEKSHSIGWFDDNELMANLAELGVFGNKDADWSDLGQNKGIPRQRVLSYLILRAIK